MRVVAITAYESLRKTVRATLRTVTSPFATRLISMASRINARSMSLPLRSIREADVGEERQPDLFHLPRLDDPPRRKLADRTGQKTRDDSRRDAGEDEHGAIGFHRFARKLGFRDDHVTVLEGDFRGGELDARRVEPVFQLVVLADRAHELGARRGDFGVLFQEHRPRRPPRARSR